MSENQFAGGGFIIADGERFEAKRRCQFECAGVVGIQAEDGLPGLDLLTGFANALNSGAVVDGVFLAGPAST